ncbi:MAG: SPFH domain-containing protein [Candidatus Micrarchaeota archaeon]|nr:SPFH domain-containing protein [Candidatus Micrarchaeota archaeon]
MQYQRGLKFRFGRFVGLLQPGLHVVIPIIERVEIVDMRLMALDITKQETLTKDNISTSINAIIFYRVTDPIKAVLNLQNFTLALFQQGQAAMKEVAGSVELDKLLYDRDAISEKIKEIVSRETDDWGIDIIALKIQDIELPADMKKAIARQAQAERDRRATILQSLGEAEAAKLIAQASEIINSTPGAMHLRTLNALNVLSSDKTNTITYVLPIEAETFDEEEEWNLTKDSGSGNTSTNEKTDENEQEKDNKSSFGFEIRKKA